ncbi:MAG: hypothetical protein HRU43_04440 [Simkaniaceae bacterium]|nr:hypothetical protein [Simkaniaceae bacterium]
MATYEDLLSDQDAFLARIVEFYGVAEEDLSEFKNPPKTMQYHFRKGDNNEWRMVMTPMQQAASNRNDSNNLF